MDEQLTFEFEQRPTIKGFPELRSIILRSYVKPMAQKKTDGLTRFSGEIIFRL